MGKIRNRKKWIAKPTRLSEGLRLARTRHKGFTQKSVAKLQVYHVRVFQSMKQAREYQAKRH